MHKFGPRRVVLVAAVLAAAMAVPTAAQIPGPRGFTVDPAKMLEAMFGADSPEEERTLAKIEVPVEEERRIGARAVQAFIESLRSQGIAVTDRGRDVAYLEDLVKTIRPLMKHGDRYPKISVYLAKSPLAEARSFPGGTLVFFEGMFERCDNEAALVGVVGHELAHLDREHQLRRVRQWKLAERRLSDRSQPVSPERFTQTGIVFAKIWTRPFRPEDELEADRDGARWAYQSGYDPRELGKLFERLRGGERAGIALPEFLQSHPDPAARRRAVIEVYDALQREQPADRLYVGKENLRRRIARRRRVFEP